MQRVKLGDICSIQAGGTPSRLVSEFWENGNIPWVKISDLNKRYILTTEERITEKGLNNSSAKMFPNETILFSIFATLGETAILKIPAATNQAIAGLQLKDKNVFLNYLYYYLLSLKQYVNSVGRGVAQNNINLKMLRNFEIPLPPIEDQKVIAERLDKVSELIEKRKEQIKKLDLLIKSRFIEMFGDPETNPKGWDKKQLEQIIILSNNGMARRGNDSNGNIVLRLVELQDGFIDYSNPNRIALNNDEKKRYLLKEKDFLFARVNGNPKNVGRCAVFNEIEEPVYHNDHIIRVHFNDKIIEGHFASVLFNSTYCKKQLHNQIKTSAGQYTVSQEGIGAIVVFLPPLKLQNQFATFVEKTDKVKQTIKTNLEKLETLKQSLMQQYFG